MERRQPLDVSNFYKCSLLNLNMLFGVLVF